MNLDNLNLVELNAQETKEVGGGFFLDLYLQMSLMEFQTTQSLTSSFLA